MKKLLKDADTALSEAVGANERLASLYHDLAMKSRDEETREFLLELERGVRRDQEELLQTMRSLFDTVRRKG